MPRSGKISEEFAARLAETVRRVERMESGTGGGDPGFRNRGRGDGEDRSKTLKCKCTEAIAKGDWGKCEIYKGEKGAEQPSGIILDVFSTWVAVPVDDTKWVGVEWMNNGYEVTVYNPC